MNPAKEESLPYPQEWEDVAEVRVFRTSQEQWSRLIGWRREMLRRGWKLLRVQTDRREMVAVFGRTRTDLKDK
ncbi:MAG: hypothetical protein IID05_10400 [Gemmatimonadetes bacterium]|nr:hypothetical protein [Gemmatimonadota bacterium]